MAVAFGTSASKRPRRTAPEELTPKLGDYLVDKGYIKAQHLENALAYRKKLKGQQEGHLLGQILIQLGYIDQPTLDKAITEQIYTLQTSLQNANQNLEQRVEQHTRALRQALDRLTQVNRYKTNFVSNISHELRTPLTHIQGYIELLTDKTLGPITSEQGEALQVLERATTRLGTLIEDLIKFSETSSGELHLELGVMKLQTIAKKAIARSVKKAEARRISISFDLPSTLPPVIADKENITTVLMQLLDNAIKFTPEGGKIKVTGNANTQNVTLAVLDTGIGISENQIERIFEAFHQLDSSATRRYGGAGLGLALVDRILKAHGTKIHAKSRLGKGSRFEFSLPIANGDRSSAISGDIS